ncbi:MAG: glycoside hydrolase family 3 protein [Chloroflexi bacterium]|nr:glycoside hydrolase family 3 protein [Chloroflexota bacterium]
MSQSLRDRLGQLLIIGMPGTKPDEETLRLLKMGIGGIILFIKNLEDAGQTRKLILGLQNEAEHFPLFIAVDQEGGMTAPVRYAETISPGNMAIGAAGNEDYARQAARLSGLEMKELGFNFVLAPVLDINNNPENPVIGTRSFGGDPTLVSCMGRAALNGYRDAAILPCAKHFPGHGDTTVDSHLDLPVVLNSREHLLDVELAPFKDAVQDGLECLMTAHVIYTGLDPENPATLSHKILTGILREKMNYRGLIITDALEMSAIAGNIPPGEAAVRAFLAGADILLVCEPKLAGEVFSHLLTAYDEGRLPENRLAESLERIEKAKKLCCACPEHDGEVNPGELFDNIARDAVTVLKNEKGILPFDPGKSGENILLIYPDSPLKDVPDIAVVFKRSWPGLNCVKYSLEDDDFPDDKISAAAGSARHILFVTAARGPLPGRLAGWIKELLKKYPEMAVAAIWNPAHIISLPEAPAYIATYDFREHSLEALRQAVSEKLRPRGRLPFELPGRDNIRSRSNTT